MAAAQAQNYGTNCAMKIEGSTLTITVDISQSHGPSKSGKSTIVGGTGGFVTLPGTGIMVGLNVVKK